MEGFVFDLQRFAVYDDWASILNYLNNDLKLCLNPLENNLEGDNENL